MKKELGKCPTCERIYEAQNDGYFWCGFCQKPYLPLDVYENRKKKGQCFLDIEEKYGV